MIFFIFFEVNNNMQTHKRLVELKNNRTSKIEIYKTQAEVARRLKMSLNAVNKALLVHYRETLKKGKYKIRFIDIDDLTENIF